MEETRVLIIDDQTIPSQTLASILRLKYPGARVETMDSALAALERIRMNEYATILCDAHQPRLDGIGFVRAVRKIRPDLPVLLLFEKLDDDFSRQSMDAGAYDVLAHPVSETTVLFAVRRATEVYRLRRHVQQERGKLINALRRMLKDLEGLYGAYGLEAHFEAFLSTGEAEKQVAPSLDDVPPR